MIVLNALDSYLCALRKGWIYAKNGHLEVARDKIHDWIGEGHRLWHCIEPIDVESECESLTDFWNNVEVWTETFHIRVDMSDVIANPDKVWRNFHEMTHRFRLN